jgi:hypothetical protein
MKLKPYRFWLPAVGVSVAALLLVLHLELDGQNLFHFLNEMINAPAYLVFQMLPCYCGGFHGGSYLWLKQFLVLSLVAVWWYLVGLELDFELLRRMAKRLRLFHHCWLVVAAGLQGLVICATFGVIITVVIHIFGKQSLDLVGEFLFITYALFLIGWLEVTSFRFWRARQV